MNYLQLLNARRTFNAETGAGGGAPAGDAGGASPLESLLGAVEAKGKPIDNLDDFSESKSEGAGDDKPGERKDDWKEYEPDPNKSDEENAAAKAEHDKAKPDPEADKVPADGKYTFDLPEGFAVDESLAEAMGKDFAEIGLTKAQAQKLAARYAETLKAREEEFTGSPAGQYAASIGEFFGEHGTPDKWLDAAKKDATIGGANWVTTEANALRFIRHLNDPALTEVFNRTGVGNHRAFIAAFAKAGELLREDNPAGGNGGGSGRPAEPAHMLFPNDVPKG